MKPDCYSIVRLFHDVAYFQTLLQNLLNLHQKAQVVVILAPWATGLITTAAVCLMLSDLVMIRRFVKLPSALCIRYEQIRLKEQPESIFK